MYIHTIYISFTQVYYIFPENTCTIFRTCCFFFPAGARVHLRAGAHLISQSTRQFWVDPELAKTYVLWHVNNNLCTSRKKWLCKTVKIYCWSVFSVLPLRKTCVCLPSTMMEASMSAEVLRTSMTTPTTWSPIVLNRNECLSLHKITSSFSAPITEEHAWAIIFECSRTLERLLVSDAKLKIHLVTHTNQIFIHKDGRVHESSFLEPGKQGGKEEVSLPTPDRWMSTWVFAFARSPARSPELCWQHCPIPRQHPIESRNPV